LIKRLCIPIGNLLVSLLGNCLNQQYTVSWLESHRWVIDSLSQMQRFTIPSCQFIHSLVHLKGLFTTPFYDSWKCLWLWCFKLGNKAQWEGAWKRRTGGGEVLPGWNQGIWGAAAEVYDWFNFRGWRVQSSH